MGRFERESDLRKTLDVRKRDTMNKPYVKLDHLFDDCEKDFPQKRRKINISTKNKLKNLLSANEQKNCGSRPTTDSIDLIKNSKEKFRKKDRRIILDEDRKDHKK